MRHSPKTKGSNMNKILAFFGLVKIERAKTLTGLLHLHYNKCITNAVLEDFSVPATIGSQEAAGKWWDKEFDRILAYNTDRVIITSEPSFAES